MQRVLDLILSRHGGRLDADKCDELYFSCFSWGGRGEGEAINFPTSADFTAKPNQAARLFSGSFPSNRRCNLSVCLVSPKAAMSMIYQVSSLAITFPGVCWKNHGQDQLKH